MCTTCGCSGDGPARIVRLDSAPEAEPAPAPREPAQHHNHPHPDATHGHAHAHGTTVELEQAILAKNDRLAERNRGWLAGRNVLALNLVSSPGSGKTTLLERTIGELAAELPVSVIEGDQETASDAERIGRTGCATVQVNTGTGCHLDAGMVAQGLRQLDPPADSMVMIENVGNLVCPALFDLGEHAKVAIVSVTEGEDKPLKYPHMFRASRVLLINKADLLPHLDFDVGRCIELARTVNPGLAVLQLSARTGEGMDGWYAWLRGHGAAAPARTEALAPRPAEAE